MAARAILGEQVFTLCKNNRIDRHSLAFHRAGAVALAEQKKDSHYSGNNN
jgi:hypothetical protein